MEYFIGLDIGTSAIKGVLISISGEEIAREKINTSFIENLNLNIEYDPYDHYSDVCKILNKLVNSVSNPSEIKAISMATASGNTLLLDKNDKPLINIISWMDGRAASLDVNELNLDEVHEIVGWPWPRGYFPLAHLLWFKENKPEMYASVQRVCMNNDWLYYCLTSNWKLDNSTATTFYLQNQVERKWHKPYLEALNLIEGNLSDLCRSGELAGTVTEQAAVDTGLSEGTPIVLGTFDHPSAARGTGFTKPGDLLLSCGTSWVGFYPVEDRGIGLSQKLLIDPFLSPDGPWGVMFALTRIDVLIHWFLDKFVYSQYSNITIKNRLFDDLAAESDPGAENCLINPNIPIDELLESKELQDSLISEYKQYSPSIITRALMEMTVFKIRSKIDQMTSAGIKAERIAMVGGPSESPIWPQIMADVTGLELNMINGQTAGAVGAAMMAGIGSGYFENESDAFEAVGGEAKIINPSSNKQIYQSIYDGYFQRYEKTN